MQSLTTTISSSTDPQLGGVGAYGGEAQSALLEDVVGRGSLPHVECNPRGCHQRREGGLGGGLPQLRRAPPELLCADRGHRGGWEGDNGPAVRSPQSLRPQSTSFNSHQQSAVNSEQ
eukprot:1176359-Prorocentrum_minimum.AAC.2